MRRRRFVQSLIAAPAAAPVVRAQQASPTRAPAEEAKIEATAAEQVAEAAPRFFTAAQFAALRRVGGILMPPMNGAPGAIEAGAAEFLDFLIGESAVDRQTVYRSGLDALNAQARKQYSKEFAEVDEAQAEWLLAPLKQPWTYDPPDDSVARFLVTAKADVRTATMNSREWNASGSAGGGRRGGGTGLYWNPI